MDKMVCSMRNEFYIDLGTANTLIYGKGRGFVLNEPSVLAFTESFSRRRSVFALGRSAKKMIGKTPPSISIVRPLKEGAISDFESTGEMLTLYIKRIRDQLFWFKPRLIISLPCRVTKFEKQAVEETGYSLGARKVHLIDEPVAAAIGAGLQVLDKRAQMIVDIGGGTTEIAVIAMGGMVVSNAIRIGADKLDSEIIDHLRTRYHFSVGEQTAEFIKLEIANADLAQGENYSCEVGGIDLQSGLPRRISLTSKMIQDPVDRYVKQIIVALRFTLSVCPPEVSGDIATSGIVLAGGGALLSGLNSKLTAALGIAVRTANDPLLSVAFGGAKALEDSKLFDIVERLQ